MSGPATVFSAWSGVVTVDWTMNTTGATGGIHEEKHVVYQLQEVARPGFSLGNWSTDQVASWSATESYHETSSFHCDGDSSKPLFEEWHEGSGSGIGHALVQQVGEDLYLAGAGPESGQQYGVHRHNTCGIDEHPSVAPRSGDSSVDGALDALPLGEATNVLAGSAHAVPGAGETMTVTWQLTRLADCDQDGIPDLSEDDPCGSPPISPLPLPQTNGPGDGQHGEDPTGEQGEPVNSLTGAYSAGRTDASLPGLGVPFGFGRAYTSTDTAVGPLGKGWRHTFMASLKEQPDQAVLLLGEDGQQLVYEPVGGGVYNGAPGARSVLSGSAQTGWTLVRTDQVRYRFDGTGRLLSVKDRNDVGVTLSYDGSGRLVLVTDPAGRKIPFSYDAAGRLSGFVLPLSRSVVFGYNAAGLLATVAWKAGSTVVAQIGYAYDAADRLTSITDANGHAVVANTYNVQGRVVQQVDARGQTSTFSWDPDTQTSSFTDARGHVWKDVYANNLLVEQIDPLGNATSYTYDANLNRATVTDPLGHIATMTYDEAGNLLSRATPAPISSVETFTYDAKNDLTSATDGRGNTTLFTYDSRGNLTSVVRPGGATNSFTRDSATGAVTAFTNPLGRTRTISYDTAGNIARKTTPLGGATVFRYDAAGRPTMVTDPRGGKTSFSWDTLDRLTTTTDPAKHATKFAYDPVGNRTKVTDANSHVALFAYDPANNLTSLTAPDGAVTSSTYDAVGNLTSRHDPLGHTTTYAYDGANRLTSQATPLGRTTGYEYDAAGNVTQTTQPQGETVSYTYDVLDRLTGIDYSTPYSLTDGVPPVAYTYDANGNRTGMTDGAGAVNYAYDVRDRLTSVTRGADTFSYVYDADSNVVSRTYPDGTATAATFDGDGRLATVAQGALGATYAYDPAGSPTRITYGGANGYVETRTYDKAGTLAGVKTAKGKAVLAEFKYTRDKVGNPVKIRDQKETQTYTYDSNDRLKSACLGNCKAGGPLTWTYDAAGNRLTETRASTTTTYSYDIDDELTSTTTGGVTTNYGYDANGNQVVAGTSEYEFDAANMLVEAAVGGTTTSYTYDGDRARLSSESGGDTTEFLWDVIAPHPLLALERDGAGALLRRYLYGNDLLAQSTPADDLYTHHDGLGNTIAATSSSGAPAWRFSYEPFGKNRSAQHLDAGTPDVPARYNGQYIDPTGLVHLRARQYDPTTGRFLSRDALSAQSGEAYGYAYGNPLVYNDPSGFLGSQLSTGQWLVLTGPLGAGLFSNGQFSTDFGDTAAGIGDGLMDAAWDEGIDIFTTSQGSPELGPALKRLNPHVLRHVRNGLGGRRDECSEPYRIGKEFGRGGGEVLLWFEHGPKPKPTFTYRLPSGRPWSGGTVSTGSTSSTGAVVGGATTSTGSHQSTIRW